MPIYANQLTGKVVGVLDGDTLDVLSPANVSYRVRLTGIDAPEKSQPFGQSAKQLLSELAFARPVTVTWQKNDRYGRVVGKAEVAGKDLGLTMIANGLAWHYKQYQAEQVAKDRALYNDSEIQARSTRKGLWSEPDPTPPWDYRKGSALSKTQASSSPCPCAGGAACHGPKGGLYCMLPSGTKQYQRRIGG